MLLLVNLSLWQIGGCLILTASAYYAPRRWGATLRYIGIQLKQLSDTSTVTNRQSTWPGEADWLADDEDTPNQHIIESKTQPTGQAIPATKCLSPVSHGIIGQIDLRFA